MNWLQPLEILSGRSLSQFLIGGKGAEKLFDRETLKRNRRQTIADIAMVKPIKFKSEEIDYLRILPKLQTEPFEMHFDFSHRTAIHDCLDFKSL